jgi:hypothetical protein
MRKPNLRTYRIVALFLLASLLFNYPVISLFNVGMVVAGVPLLYVYVFAAWAFVIVAAALVIEGGG